MHWLILYNAFSGEFRALHIIDLLCFGGDISFLSHLLEEEYDIGAHISAHPSVCFYVYMKKYYLSFRLRKEDIKSFETRMNI